MSIKPFDYLSVAHDVATNPDWRAALDNLVHTLRAGFIFDNLAIFLAQGGRVMPEVVFARAIGRGHTAEADAAWGEEIANKIYTDGELLLHQPSSKTTSKNRLDQPYLLGVPLRTPDRVIGAVVFVRFGGPVFEDEHIGIAKFVASQVSLLLERRALIDVIGRLDAAQRQIQLQEDFIATISHELRTPLGYIKGYSTTLLRTDTHWDVEIQREFLSIIDEEADHLQELIENVLESARLQSGTLPINFQPVRLDAVLRDITSRNQARQKDLRVDVVAAVNIPLVEADAVRLSQVIDNLFSNAIKYAPGAKISINVMQKGERVQIRFNDAGPGIPAESLPYLFDRFFRVPEQSLKRSGTGLGLYICKQIVEAHRGTISVESSPGKGTTFYISLPSYQPVK